MSERKTPGVGRGRPPVHSQFQPGQSGNPRGRPKDSRNLMTLLHNELDQWVDITVSGKRRRIRKSKLMVMQIVNASVGPKPDPKAILAILKLASQSSPPSSAPDTASVLGGDDDRELLQLFIQSMKDDNDGTP